MSIRNPSIRRHELKGPEQFIVWASRHYLWSAIRGTPAPSFVFEAFENAGIDILYYCLDRVLVCLLAAPTSEIIVHNAGCPCVARHEQALLMGLRRLQQNDDPGFAATMSAIMLPTAVKVSEPPMKLLADGLPQMKASADHEYGRTRGTTGRDESPDEAAWWPHASCGNRTIN